MIDRGDAKPPREHRPDGVLFETANRDSAHNLPPTTPHREA
jgi:hypothetical protein